MTTILKLRRGSNSQSASFTGAEGEVIVNTDKDCLVLHDGSTVGGFEHVNLNSNQRLTNKDIVGVGLSVVGVATATNGFVGNITGDVNSAGVSTFSNLRIGTAVTISSGIVSATSFYGDGSNLTNTGSTLSVGSGTQRIVLTSQTSGTMTLSSTNQNLTFDSSTGILSTTSFSGNLIGNINSTGISTFKNTIVGGATTEVVINGDVAVSGTTTSITAHSQSYNGKTGTLESTVGSSLGTTGTVDLDMKSLTGTYQTINMSGTITFTTSNRLIGRSVSIRLNPGASGRTLTYPVGWRFVGEKITSLSASKLAILTLTFFGSNDSDCIAAIAVEL